MERNQNREGGTGARSKLMNNGIVGDAAICGYWQEVQKKNRRRRSLRA